MGYEVLILFFNYYKEKAIIVYRINFIFLMYTNYVNYDDIGMHVI